MPPKKAQKMSLNEFLGDNAFGSWADEMDSLPTAPSMKTDEDRSKGRDYGRSDRDFGRSDRDYSSRDRPSFPPREEVPLPTQPPYTAFIGNLPFDLTEGEIENHFAPHKAKSVKIIRDRDDRPKGFGYVEFDSLDGLKEALAKTGSSLAGRTIRVSVADPPKQQSGFGGGGGGFDDDKFSGSWRREGPLPSDDRSRSRFDDGGRGGGFGSRFSREGQGEERERERPPPSLSDANDDWRSNRPSPRIPPATLASDAPPIRRRGSGFTANENAGAADTEENWTMGSKFKPTSEEPRRGGKFGGKFGGDMGPPPPKDAGPSAADEGNWRSARKTNAPPTPRSNSFEKNSPSNSTPPTPQMGRRKLELLPRSNAPSAVASPLSSPKSAAATTFGGPRANPFGAAKPIDVSAREKEVTEKLEKGRETWLKDRDDKGPARDRGERDRPASRQGSRAPSERSHTPPPAAASPATQSSNLPAPRTFASNSVRPAFSFANAAGSGAASGAKPSLQRKTSANSNLGKEPVSEEAVDKITEAAKEIVV